MKKILLLPGDGIGVEIIQQTRRVLAYLIDSGNFSAQIVESCIGGTAYDRYRDPCPQATLKQVDQCGAVLLGAVGGHKWDKLPKESRPETGLLKIRAHMDVFANLRPAYLLDSLSNSSTLKPEIVRGLDILFVRELTSGIYFGKPRGVTGEVGKRVGVNTLYYTEDQIRRIAHIAFSSAQKRNKKVCSVDKANVLEVMQLWRAVVEDVATHYPAVELTHMYVDNAAMQLVKNPTQFDVMLTSNLFGDILSDCAAMLTGSIGVLPSAAINASKKGLYEPVHGSAPDIAGQNVANPIATILSLGMMLAHSFDRHDLSMKIHQSVSHALEAGYRTGDIKTAGNQLCSTTQMTDHILKFLQSSTNMSH